MRKIANADYSIENFDALRISVASPDDILNWSYGEVTKPETINYRTQKPERDGLFDERIFGPTKDFECYCGKYKKVRFKGVVCDKCGVEVTKSSVRRDRMGHIELSVPVAHIWYFRGIPSIMSLILDISMNDLEKVIYFSSYIVLGVNEEVRSSILSDLEKEYEELKAKKETDKTTLDFHYKEAKKEIHDLKPKRLMTEIMFHDLSLKYGNIVKVGIGAEAVYELLKQIDIPSEINRLLELVKIESGDRRKYFRLLRLLTDMQKAGIKPEWIVFKRLPVLPPDLRPMVQLDGGRFAASDLNDLYRRVINRNNRLKRLLGTGAPEVITRNEKRMLQEAVDALIDNSSRRGKGAQTSAAGSRKLRSLSDMLRGKQGRFRQNLLGKRVDYSGRSVIVAGPSLRLNQCGLPKVMALEMFKPFVVSKLISEGYVHNVKNASHLIERGTPEVWDILERITSKSYVLLNRAPTLHRLGIQAFQPILIEGKSIQIHPLVCYAFNADFDGDQMAVHVPLSAQSKWEAENIMQSTRNLLKPASGEPVVQARYDIVFGCFYLTRFKEGAEGEGKLFSGKNEAILAYHIGELDVRAKVKVRLEGKITETSVGRILFNNILPDGTEFVNEVMDNKKLKKIVKDIYLKYGLQKTAEFVDKMKDIGFEYAAVSGLTISMGDVFTPASKDGLIKSGNALIDTIEKQYRRGLITVDEKNLKTIEVWQDIRQKIEEDMVKGYDRESPIYLMVSSGARGSFAQVIQMGGMKGLVVNPAGEIITLPIKSSFKEGLDVYEYFISTHGARKGKSDTSLRTSDAGYLTRRLVDVAQDLVISQADCKTKLALTITESTDTELGETLSQRIAGRVAVSDILKGKKVLVRQGEIITDETADKIVLAGISSVAVRSPMFCQADWGICQKCYGVDLGSGAQVELGESVGIIAAQAIGEPGTQLTMKTFHLGGVSGEDITSGLPRVEELFEARVPRPSALISEFDGKVKISHNKDYISVLVVSDSPKVVEVAIPEGYEITIKDKDVVKARSVLATAKDKKVVRAPENGQAEIKNNTIYLHSQEKSAKEHAVSLNSNLVVENGQSVAKGDLITDDHIDLALSLELRGLDKTQSYIIEEVQKIYASQGQSINDKHIELIVRQMLSKVKVNDGGGSDYLSGQIVDRLTADKVNQELSKKHLKPIQFENIILGISRVALKTDSFLSAASFQETTSVLLESAVKGRVDQLKGLKENVIIGKLIPAGTGFSDSYKKDKKDADHKPTNP